MKPPIVFDGLRQYLGVSAGTPRGVNRVDLIYGRYLFENWPSDCFGALPTPWGIRLYDRDISLRFLSYVQDLWRESHAAGTEPAYEYVCEQLLSGAVAAQHGAKRRRRGLLAGIPRVVNNIGLNIGDSAIQAAPLNAIYVNVGQVCWASPFTTRWLRHRPDIRAVFMLHDVIPLERPELVSRVGQLEMAWMLRTVIRRASGLITTTQAASDAVVSMLCRKGLPDIPVCAMHLPVDDVFLQRDPPDEALRAREYFLVCGAIEPRKNLSVLLRVWERLVERFGDKVPRLVVAGTVEKDGEPILLELARSEALRTHVIVVSGLGSPSLRRVMANARALLMPSLAEGFGLPVVEALTVGTPVLASDIPAHREIGGNLVVYLEPMNDEAWFNAILRFTTAGAEGSRVRERLIGYTPLTTTRYFEKIGEFLGSLG